MIERVESLCAVTNDNKQIDNKQINRQNSTLQILECYLDRELFDDIMTII